MLQNLVHLAVKNGDMDVSDDDSLGVITVTVKKVKQEYRIAQLAVASARPKPTGTEASRSAPNTVPVPPLDMAVLAADALSPSTLNAHMLGASAWFEAPTPHSTNSAALHAVMSPPPPPAVLPTTDYDTDSSVQTGGKSTHQSAPLSRAAKADTTTTAPAARNRTTIERAGWGLTPTRIRTVEKSTSGASRPNRRLSQSPPPSVSSCASSRPSINRRSAAVRPHQL